MSEFDERISKAYDLIGRYGRSESDIHYETGLDADDCFRDLMVYVKGLVARIAELEAKNNRLVELAEGLADMVDWSGCDCDKPFILTEWEEFIAEVQE